MLISGLYASEAFKLDVDVCAVHSPSLQAWGHVVGGVAWYINFTPSEISTDFNSYIKVDCDRHTVLYLDQDSVTQTVLDVLYSPVS